MQKYAENNSLAPGAVIRVTKTGAPEVIQESFSTYVKCHSGQAHSRHAVSMLCGPLRVPYDQQQFNRDVEIARGVVQSLKTQGLVVIENLVGERERIAAAREADKLSLDDSVMFTAGTGAGVAHKRDGSLRGDTMMWLPKDGSLPHALQHILNKVNRLRRSIAYVTGRPLLRASSQLARYPGDGVGYVKHRDSKLTAEAKDKRRLTLLYYFNEDWEPSQGGCLEVFPQSGKTQLAEWKADSASDNARKSEEKMRGGVQIQPRSGTLAIFPSSRLHRVLPDHAPRVAMGTWFLGPESLEMSHPDSEHDIDSFYEGNDEVFPSR